MFLKSRFGHFHHRCFFTVKVLLPEEPISTLQEFDLPSEKYKSPLNAPFNLILFPFVECVSCKNVILLGNILLLK